MFSLVLGLVGPMAAFAATTPSLGAAATYGVLSSTYTDTSAATMVNGDVGFNTAPATPPAGTHTHYGSGAPYTTAGGDQASALSDLASQTCTFTFATPIADVSTDGPAGGVYTPGVYCSTGAMNVGIGGITLNGSGTYIFRSNGALTSTAGSVVTQVGGSACDVFWTPTGATTLAATTTFVGTVIDGSAITVGAGTTWTGRALSYNGTVTTDSDTITVPTCTLPPACSGGGVPGAQCGSVTVNCPAPSGGLSIANVPGDILFSGAYGSTTITSSPTNVQSAFDNGARNGFNLPLTNALQIDDNRSGDIDQCPGSGPGFTVTVQATSLADGHGHSIPNSSLRVITSNLLDAGTLGSGLDTSTLRSQITGEEVRYSKADGSGNRHDVTAPKLYDNEARNDTLQNNNFRNAANYQKICQAGETDCSGPSMNNTLNNSVTILRTTTGHNMSFVTNVAIMIDQGIAVNLSPGSYNGTITYTISAQ